MEKLFPIGKVAMKVLRPISKIAFKIEMPDKQAMNDIEKMVIEETKRNYMYLNLYNTNVDALYINRIMPEDIDNSFF